MSSIQQKKNTEPVRFGQFLPNLVRPNSLAERFGQFLPNLVGRTVWPNGSAEHRTEPRFGCSLVTSTESRFHSRGGFFKHKSSLLAHCQLHFKSFQERKTESQGVKTHTFTIEHVKKDISSICHAKEQWTQVTACSLLARKCLKNPTQVAANRKYVSEIRMPPSRTKMFQRIHLRALRRLTWPTRPWLGCSVAWWWVSDPHRSTRPGCCRPDWRGRGVWNSDSDNPFRPAQKRWAWSSSNL